MYYLYPNNLCRPVSKHSLNIRSMRKNKPAPFCAFVGYFCKLKARLMVFEKNQLFDEPTFNQVTLSSNG